MSSSSSESIRDQVDFPSWRFATQKRLSAPPQYQHLMEENEGKTILVRPGHHWRANFPKTGAFNSQKTWCCRICRWRFCEQLGFLRNWTRVLKPWHVIVHRLVIYGLLLLLLVAVVVVVLVASVFLTYFADLIEDSFAIIIVYDAGGTIEWISLQVYHDINIRILPKSIN